MEVVEYKHRGMATKCEILVEACNKILAELYFRTMCQGEVRDYYDIGMIAYSGKEICSVFTDDLKDPFVSVTTLRNTGSHNRVAIRLNWGTEPSKGSVRREGNTIIVSPQGGTPTYEALLYVREVASKWCNDPKNQHSYPLTVLHLSDNRPTDCDIDAVRCLSQQIMSNKVIDGQVLLFNILLDPDMMYDMVFPTDAEVAEYQSQYLTAMAESSSSIPQCYMESINKLRSEPTAESCRGFGLTSSMSQVISMISIGTELSNNTRS